LVEGLVDLLVPPRFSASVASLAPWCRSVCDVSELGCKVVDCVVDLTGGVEGCQWKVKPFSLCGHYVTVYRVPAPPWRFVGALPALW
jgi:hypothetical protein